MIYTHPVGGMGNMFFNIAALYALAKDNGDILVLTNIDYKIKSLINDGRINLDHAPIYKYFLNRFPQENFSLPRSLYTHQFEYLKIPYLNGYEYHGYFQSEKYFKHRKDEIINLFRPSDESIPIINEYRDRKSTRLNSSH